MGFSDAVRSVLGKYATFEGRAARSEFWYFILFLVIVNIILNIIDTALLHTVMHTGAGDVVIIASLFSLAMLIPNLAVAVRRLHDVGHSGWWLLIGLTGIGGLVLLFWYVSRGQEGPNEYGPAPVA
jgi:uncharacterized membrane protein YhaH (DUF805 family)